MEILFAVTIDTECDKGPGWRVQQPLRFRSVLEGVPQRLQPLFERLGARPTYLLSPEVIEQDECAALLKQYEGRVELATHLHGEFVEPGRPEAGSVVATHDLQGQYPPEVERAKLENLTTLFAARFGCRPRSFRAGRFGIGRHSLRFLEELGYRVDSSVTPFAVHDGFHFWGCPTRPYHPAAEDPCRRGTLRILEAPVTIHSRLLGRLPEGWLRGQEPHALWYRVARRLLGRDLIRPAWLRPSFRDFADMKRVMDAHLEANEGRQRALLVMMFHSVELIAGASPYAQTEGEVGEFVRRLAQALEYARQLGARFIGLSEAAELSWD